MYVVGGVEDVSIMVESVGGGKGSDDESYLETKVYGAFEIDDLPEGVEEEVKGIGFFLVVEDSPSLRIFIF